MPFPNTVNLTQAPAVAGQWASANPRHSILSVEGGFVAGASGVNTGLFVWADATNKLVANTGSGVPTGFLVNAMQGTNTTYLSEYTTLIPAGFGVGDVHNGGDFWVKNAGAGAVTVGMKAYANNTTGAISFAATGATVAGATETKYYAYTAGAAGELIKMSSTPL